MSFRQRNSISVNNNNNNNNFNDRRASSFRSMPLSSQVASGVLSPPLTRLQTTSLINNKKEKMKSIKDPLSDQDIVLDNCATSNDEDDSDYVDDQEENEEGHGIENGHLIASLSSSSTNPTTSSSRQMVGEALHLQILNEVLRNIAKHFLEPMRIRAQLKPPASTTLKYIPRVLNPFLSSSSPSSTLSSSSSSASAAASSSANLQPTLAELTRYHRLTRIASIMEEILFLDKSFLKWLTINNLPTQQVDIIKKSYEQINNICADMQQSWMSVRIKMEAMRCLTYGESMEQKISELHLFVEMILDELAKIAMSLIMIGNTKTANPLTSAAVADLEISMPTKYPCFIQVKKSYLTQQK